EDYLFATYREHGYALARGADPGYAHVPGLKVVIATTMALSLSIGHRASTAPPPASSPAWRS
ncbi:MAG: hypothetical protein ACRDN0_02660, partial [Trebonia sp.]